MTSAVNDETFRLMLDGHEVPVAVDYTVNAGVLTVPAAFEMTVGHAGQLRGLVDAFPAFTPFQLYVGDTLVQTGETDGYAPTGSQGSQLKIRGRDMLKWLVDSRIPSDRTFSEKTYLQLTEIALEEVGLGDSIIFPDNISNLAAITGKRTVKELVPPTTEETQTEVGEAEGRTRTVYKTLKGEVGSTWWDFLSEQYRRAGLFLWSSGDGNFVLARPNGKQSALSQIVRLRSSQGRPGEVTVLGQPQFNFDSTQRYTACVVHGRSGGGKEGRGTVTGRAYDSEMIGLLNDDMDADGYRAAITAWETAKREGKPLPQLPRRKELIVKDDKVRTTEQAVFLARRKVAESRRNGWSLSYTVAGHTAPAKSGGGRVVWAPDMVVDVIDEELGIEGPMYVESCVYRRQPHTTTELKLMRLEDLVFAEEDVERPPPKLARKKGVANVRVGKTEVYSVEEVWKADPNWGGLPTLAGHTLVKRGAS